MKDFRSAVTAFIITAGAFCSLLFTVGMLLLPARVGNAEIPAGENLFGVEDSKPPEPISLKIMSDKGGGMLLYLNFSSVTADVYLFKNAEELRPADTDYFFEADSGLAGRLCDRLGGIELGRLGQKERYFGPALEQYLNSASGTENQEEISSAFFEKFANTGLSSDDLAFIMENGRTDLNFPLCYDILEYLPELFANVNFR